MNLKEGSRKEEKIAELMKEEDLYLEERRKNKIKYSYN